MRARAPSSRNELGRKTQNTKKKKTEIKLTHIQTEARARDPAAKERKRETVRRKNKTKTRFDLWPAALVAQVRWRVGGGVEVCDGRPTDQKGTAT